MKPGVPGKIARMTMMQNVWFRYQPPCYGEVFPAIGILDPVGEPGNKIGDEHGRNKFDGNHPRSVTARPDRVLIDKNRGRHRFYRYEPAPIGTLLSCCEGQRSD